MVLLASSQRWRRFYARHREPLLLASWLLDLRSLIALSELPRGARAGAHAAGRHGALGCSGGRVAPLGAVRALRLRGARVPALNARPTVAAADMQSNRHWEHHGGSALRLLLLLLLTLPPFWQVGGRGCAWGELA